MIATRTLVNQASGDPNFSSVSLLLHMDGTNGSTTFTDSGPNALAVTAVGDAKISTAQSKYGGASGYFDGTGDYLTIASNALFSFGLGDFTIELWVYPTASTGVLGLYGTSGGSGSNPKFVIHLDSLVPKIHYNALTGGSNIYTSANSAIAINQWSNLAFVRQGTTWVWYINGTASGTGSNSTTVTFSSQTTYVGYGGETYFLPFLGYLDELRVTKGLARYTANFTPTGPFSNS